MRARLQLFKYVNYRCAFNETLRMFSNYPKHSVVAMPALSPTMTQGTIATWLKKEGDSCAPGDTVAEIETDKATMAFECQDDFFIAKLLVPSGSEILVGAPIMVTVETADAVAAFANYKAPASTPAPTSFAVSAPAPIAAPVPAPAPAPVPASSSPPKAAAPTTPPAATPAPVAPAPKSAVVTPLAGIYSVPYSGSSKNKSPLFNKLLEDRKKYEQKYGRTGHKA